MIQCLVSVVILNYNCRDFIINCIDSVLKQTYSNIELIVIDNNSSDDSLSIIKQSYPDVHIHCNEKNIGFSKAHNIGINITKGEYYVPLNPDVILEYNFIERMIMGFEQAEMVDITVGSASGKVYFTDRSGNPTNKIYTTGHLLTKNRKPHNRGYKQVDTQTYDSQQFIFGVNGACPMYSRIMLEDVKFRHEYFDEDFFLYGDDYDLGWRAQLLGWKSIFVPQAVAYHFGKGSGGLYKPSIQFQYARNHYLTIIKNDILLHFIMDIHIFLAYELFWQIYLVMTDQRRFIEHNKAIINTMIIFRKALTKRKAIQSRRRVSSVYIRSLFSKAVFW